MLHLYRAATPDNLRDSDAICSALQLINFWQDVAIDWQKQRVYLPQDDLLRFGVSEQQIADAVVDGRWQALMQFEINRARSMLCSGAPLARRLPGRIGWELRLVIQGGLQILRRLEQVNGDIFDQRPKLNWRDWIIIGWRALTMGALPTAKATSVFHFFRRQFFTLLEDGARIQHGALLSAYSFIVIMRDKKFIRLCLHYPFDRFGVSDVVELSNECRDFIE
eukprot:gene11694-14912_t